jgi:hypothetical protein
MYIFSCTMLLLKALLALLLVAVPSGASAGDQAKQWILFRRSDIAVWDSVWRIWSSAKPKRILYNTDSYYRVVKRREKGVTVDIKTFTYKKEEDPNSYNPAKRTGWNWRAEVNCTTQRAWTLENPKDVAPYIGVNEQTERIKNILQALPISLCQTDETLENKPNPPLPSTDATTTNPTTKRISDP